MLKSKFVTGLAIAAVATTAFMGVAAAQVTDTASGGNGGVSTADSSGGSVSIGSTNSGGSTGTIQAILDDALVSGDDIAAQVIASILGHE
jgi:hypothetical protein